MCSYANEMQTNPDKLHLLLKWPCSSDELFVPKYVLSLRIYDQVSNPGGFSVFPYS